MFQKSVSLYGIIFCVLCISVNFFAKAKVLNRTVATIAVGDTPADIAITPNGKFGYVANNNNDGLVNGDSVSVLDLEFNQVRTTIHDASFNQPYTVTMNAAGSLAYVTNSNAATVTVIATITNTVSAVITGFDGPSGLVIAPDGKTAYVNNYGGPILGSGNGRTVRVVDLDTNAIIGSAITVGLAPAALAITPDGACVYVANYVDGNPGTGTISVIETASNSVIKTISGFSGPFSIKISSDGLYAYVTNFGSNNFSPYGRTVSVVSLESDTIVDTIVVGIQPAGLALSPNGKFAYVTNYNTLYLGADFTDLTAGQGTVNVINLCNNTVLPQAFLTGSSPSSVAVSPDGRYLYVTNYSSNNVSVIDIYDKIWLNICV